MLFFYPFDFTFVCPTEILTFSEKAAEFEAKGVQVRGLATPPQLTHSLTHSLKGTLSAHADPSRTTDHRPPATRHSPPAVLFALSLSLRCSVRRLTLTTCILPGPRRRKRTVVSALRSTSRLW